MSWKLEERPFPKWMINTLKCFNVPQNWLWTYVELSNPDDCWLWNGSVNGEGYGRAKFSGKMQLAHRVAYAICRGLSIKQLNKTKLLVLHSCDHPRCCNPRHLRLGTHQDNMNDKLRRGRGRNARGSAHPNALLTERKVIAIRKRRNVENPSAILRIR